jgi:hypothetical protein
VIFAAGGVGITAIAPLHYSLIRGLPVGHASWVMWAAQLFQEARRAAAGIQLGTWDIRGFFRAVSAAVLSGTVARRPRTLTTIWSTRDGSLINAFSHMLDPDPAQTIELPAPPSDLAASATPLGALSIPRRSVDTEYADGLGSSGARSARELAVTPRSNALTKGERLAKARKWASSFSIHATRTFGEDDDADQAACGENGTEGHSVSQSPTKGMRSFPSASSTRSAGGGAVGSAWRAGAAGKTVVDLRVHLTSGRKKPAPALVPGDAGAVAAPAPVPSVGMALPAQVLLPSLELPAPATAVRPLVNSASVVTSLRLPTVPESHPLDTPASLPAVPSAPVSPAPRPRSLGIRWGSARALLEAGAAALVHGPAPPPDATVSCVSPVLTATAGGHAAALTGAAAGTAAAYEDAASLPVVARLRPDIPKLLADVADSLALSKGGDIGPAFFPRQKGSSFRAGAPFLSRGTSRLSALLSWDSVLGRIWAFANLVLWTLGRILCLCGRPCCRRAREASSSGQSSGLHVNEGTAAIDNDREAILLPDISSGVDYLGRTAIAVVVCGPQEMVLSTLEACRALNEASAATGRPYIFHVHSETFSF